MREDTDELETKILKKLYVWLVVGGITIGGLGGSGVLRVDKFTATDGKQLERRIDKIEGRLGVIEYRLDEAHP